MINFMKLYRINLRGYCFKEYYAVAEDSAKAYEKVRAYLDKNNLAFEKDREMETITLLADETLYPDCEVIFIL